MGLACAVANILGGSSALQSRAFGFQSTMQGIPSGSKRFFRAAKDKEHEINKQVPGMIRVLARGGDRRGTSWAAQVGCPPCRSDGTEGESDTDVAFQEGGPATLFQWIRHRHRYDI